MAIHNHYRLCESYRDGQHIRNRTLLSLGNLEQELNSQQINIFVHRINELYRGEKTRILSAFRDEKTENLALYYCRSLKEAEATLKAERKARGIEEVVKK
ncbi:hypothetical protein FACS189437_06500 [Bacteroidia bacterium]|nr:hypothetical protein FACS189437_06500 [Bacteroidia bacterium]